MNLLSGYRFPASSGAAVAGGWGKVRKAAAETALTLLSNRLLPGTRSP